MIILNFLLSYYIGENMRKESIGGNRKFRTVYGSANVRKFFHYYKTNGNCVEKVCHKILVIFGIVLTWMLFRATPELLLRTSLRWQIVVSLYLLPLSVNFFLHVWYFVNWKILPRQVSIFFVWLMIESRKPFPCLRSSMVLAEFSLVD